jgi:hypothetical protein
MPDCSGISRGACLKTVTLADDGGETHTNTMLNFLRARFSRLRDLRRQALNAPNAMRKRLIAFTIHLDRIEDKLSRIEN